MSDTEPYSGPERRGSERSDDIQLRRRENRPVEVERRRSNPEGFDIAAALELHLDQCKTRRAMIALLEQWLEEARSREQESQDPEYISAVERAIAVMKGAPDVETAIVTLQRR
jgi:hypothetical protein